MKIVFTTEAKILNRKNINYLIDEWNTEVVENYLFKLNQIITFLEKGIITGQFDENLGLYKILIVKQIYLFYEILNNEISITTIWNNYKNPYWLI